MVWFAFGVASRVSLATPQNKIDRSVNLLFIVFLFVYLSLYLSICQCVCLCNSLSIYVAIDLSV